MSKTVIKIENLSKIYRLGEVGTGTISHDLNRWWKMNILGQDDPFAKIGHLNDRAAKAEKGELIAALQDINLEVKEGEILGIIGKNGAGKSTLLKILSRVTSPTTGSIKIKGRMASLLEVGTGFHPEMTGRENIYMNGTIMGMRKWEIDKQLDAIVDFAGVAKYLDTPVKRYSSGMTVRLGFAIAAHLEPEILVVDEVLAVGDAEFQKKAIGKMQDVSKNDGRTVLFVSHNMTAIQSLCPKSLQMEQGRLIALGDTETIINKYLVQNISQSLEQIWDQTNYPGNEHIEVRSVRLVSKSNTLLTTTPFSIEIEFRSLTPNKLINVSLVLKTSKGDVVLNDISESKSLNTNWQKATIYFQGNFLNDEIYTIDNYFVEDRSTVLFIHKEPITFEVHEPAREDMNWYGKWIGVVRPKFNWEYNEI